MTREQFESQYAYNSRTTVQWLHQHGRRAEPCNCGDKQCQGWQMISSKQSETVNSFESRYNGRIMLHRDNNGVWSGPYLDEIRIQIIKELSDLPNKPSDTGWDNYPKEYDEYVPTHAELSTKQSEKK